MDVTIPYSFRARTVSSSAELNANFDALYDFVNDDAVHRDGTNPFEALPSIPANPTSASQIVRYAYAKLSPQINPQLVTTVFGSLTNKPAAGNTNKWSCVAGWKDVTFTAGSGVLVLPTAFPTAIVSVFASVSGVTGTGGDGRRLRCSTSTAVDRFTLRLNTFTGTAQITFLAFGF